MDVNEKKPSIFDKVREMLQNRRDAKSLPDPEAEIGQILSGLLKEPPPKDERKEQFDRMRSALREARAERREIRSVLEHYHSEVTPARTARDVNEMQMIVTQASNRGLLVKGMERDDSGEKKAIELNAIKENEPYEKRPSIRASREGRGEGTLIGTYRKSLLDKIDVEEISTYRIMLSTTQYLPKREAKEADDGMRKLYSGDRSFLETLKTREDWKPANAIFEKQREAVRDMSKVQLLQRRREENSQARSNEPAIDRW